MRALTADPGFAATRISAESSQPVKLLVRRLAQDADAGARPVPHGAPADIPGDSFAARG